MVTPSGTNGLLDGCFLWIFSRWRAGGFRSGFMFAVKSLLFCQFWFLFLFKFAKLIPLNFLYRGIKVVLILFMWNLFIYASNNAFELGIL